MTSKEIKAKFADARKHLVDNITHFLERNKANELEITKTIVYATVDEQYDHVIYKIKKDGIVVEDTLQSDHYDVNYEDISNDILIELLETLEKGKYKVFEDAEL